MAGSKGVSRREREILDSLYKLGSGSVKDVQEDLNDGSNESTIRTLLGILVTKKKLIRKADGLKYVYHPAIERKKASKLALERVVKTFFDESPVLAANSLLEMGKGEITEEEIDLLDNQIQPFWGENIAKVGILAEE